MKMESYVHSEQKEQNEQNEATPAHPVGLQDLPVDAGRGPSLFSGSLQLINGLRITLRAAVGDAEISVGELFALKEGSVLKLDRPTDAPLDILLDGKLIARGSLVVVGDHFGVRVEEIASDLRP